LHAERALGEVEVVGLLTTLTEDYRRVSMHGVRQEVLFAQADAVGLPLCCVKIPAPCPNAVYEEKMGDAIEEAKRQGVNTMIFGDLFLEEVRAYREKQLAGTGVTPRFPLWHERTDVLAARMISEGLRAYVTCLDPGKMPITLAGRMFDKGFLQSLPEDVDPCAENGEFHTCVAGGPMFRHAIPVEVGQTVERDGLVFTDLTLAGGRGDGR
jgi:uncharacterized protein (TIGR00290 family)